MSVQTTSGTATVDTKNMHPDDGEMNAAVLKALADDKREGLRLAVRARWVALAVIGVLIAFVNGTWPVLYYEFLLACFALIGWAQLKIGRLGRSRPELFLMFLDLALMTAAFVFPNPLDEQAKPLAMQYQLGDFNYFFVLLAGATLAYSWRTIFAMGVWTAGLWVAGFVWVSLQPLQFPELTARVQAALAGHDILARALDPNNVRIGDRIQELVVFLIVAGILAIGSRRANRLLIRHAGVERERANLARYFSPNVVDQLADSDESLKQVRTQDVAVLFIDIFGFTALADKTSPADVIGTLRDFFERMEADVFRHGGTLDKYLGDGLMATFGTPIPGSEDATNALRCARDMIEGVEAWNRERQARGEEPIRVGIGLHFGKAVLGDIGSNRLEFAVIGGTVNVASRLEALTRPLDVSVVASDDLVARIREEPVECDGLLSDFERREAQQIRGVKRSVDIWTLPTA